MMEYLSAGLGGIGLFLLGMWLITEGLRLAAGPSLEAILASRTSSKRRGLVAGTFLTALVQSSSVVTVAVIGFVNAGLITFQRAVWVIFGSNLGTTLTAWLVALIGFKLKIDAFALPIIGLGALMRIFSPTDRYRSFGMALAGFGILFLGIETLSGGFSSLSDKVSLDDERYGVVIMVVIGAVLTTLMMSSSAAMAVVLTALAGGLIGFADAAAVVIGTNIGTTTTALLATIGATSSAKRLAIAHVFFNVLTGAVALVFLEPLLAVVLWAGDLTGHGSEATTLLALFHTLFNLIGIVLMWPLEPIMSRFLLTRFVVAEEQSIKLRFLDQNVAAVPDAVPMALCREFEPLLAEYPDTVAGLLDPDPERRTQSRLRHQRLEAIGDFFVEASRYPINTNVANLFSVGWRIQHNLLYVDETLLRLDDLGELLRRSPDYERLREPLGSWFNTVSEHLNAILSGTEGTLDFVVLAPAYEQVKLKLLQLALAGQISRVSLDSSLQMCSLSRRFAEQWLRALHHWQGMKAANEPAPAQLSTETTEAAAQAPPADPVTPPSNR
ncbi:MAG: Na/Pi symporter [Alcanivoracaceae bacterium]|jgi:phosphate:Na+ symporter|nr:Na/Pi symporter [Alcanivoracaceae bacterium]